LTHDCVESVLPVKYAQPAQMEGNMQVSIRHAGDRLAGLGDEPIILTSHGTPKAFLLSIQVYEHLTGLAGQAKALQQIREAQEALCQEINTSWQSDKTAVELITEQRR
jgi:hypothetical protein